MSLSVCIETNDQTLKLCRKNLRKSGKELGEKLSYKSIQVFKTTMFTSIHTQYNLV